MDAFFAAVEQRDDPGLRGKPVVIGADPLKGNGRGVVSTCSYEARKYGIRSAMPVTQAYRRCPHAVFIHPAMGKYASVSKDIMKIFGEFTPLVEPLSIDEAFLDCSGTEHLFGDDRELGFSIKKRIKEVTGLTASVGIASNKSVAKIASDLEKPDGLVICEPGREKEFLSGLDVGRIWGAGEKSVKRLNAMGIRTIGDLADMSMEQVQASFGKSGRSLWALANGIDPREITQDNKRKSISEERTFHIDTRDRGKVLKTLFSLSVRVAAALREKKLAARTVTLKLRTGDFVTHTRSKTLDNRFSDTETLRRTILALYQTLDREEEPVRLVGVGVSGLAALEGAVQGDLFDDKPLKSGKVDQVIDQVSGKYGGVIKRAVFMDPKGPNSVDKNSH